MSNYIMNINKELSNEEYGNIYDYLGIICVYDDFTMNIKDANQINFDIINKIFEEKNIIKIQEITSDDGRCIIKGNKIY